KGKNLYTSTNGIPQIREAVAHFVNTRFGAKVDPETNILMTVGGMEAIFLAARILLEKGDRVLLPDPGWGVMRTVVERQGAVADYYPLREGERWAISHEAILDRMDEKTKLVVVNAPSNPTGAMLSREGWASLLEQAQAKGVFVLSDEVYHNYVYEGEHVSGLSFDALDNLIFINSFSKTFAVTGWRLGYAIAHPWIIRQMGIFKESISLCSFSIGQWAMADYLGQCDDYLQKARDLCRTNMERLVKRLNALPGVRCTPPQGGVYVFPDFSEVEPSSQRLFERLLSGGTAVVPGVFFGSRGEGRARLMFACPGDHLDRCLERIEATLKG
ncbi:MAG: pyridoxal phosphate-dependent aminotransferase, partial [Desulfobacterales bacterium]|nr:pyridoxal phosphate-dependent aminotransferase [Desulfobacterales bacterium]